MPQVLHVVQCYKCRYQVEIVKKAPKWTCKLCGEKQSLKTVFFQGSGKECRLQVQQLNELKGNAEQSHFSGDSHLIHLNLSDELDEHPPEEIKTQSNWSDFVDEHEDDIYDEIFTGPSIEFIDREACYGNQENSKPKVYQQTLTEILNGDSAVCNNIVQTKRTIDESFNCFSDSRVPATKLRKIETHNTTQQSEWDQYLPDELSD